MGLVEYSDSEPEDERNHVAKKPKTETADALPSLPAVFLDLYSSTVRTSTRDDSSLHAGRKRVIPHVEGNWPAHVYLEWFPSHTELDVLDNIVSTAQHGRCFKDSTVHSLLHNNLGVALPLHVSLSRPLVLRTEQKDAFKALLEAKIKNGRLSPFVVTSKKIEWHPNEDSSRHFLVMRLAQPEDAQLSRLLTICNDTASDFDLPLLYAGSRTSSDLNDGQDQFHISIAWSLQPEDGAGRVSLKSYADDVKLNEHRPIKSINFSAVKIRIGQDVSTIPLAYRGRS